MSRADRELIEGRYGLRASVKRLTEPTNLYQVWIEGFSATGQCDRARLLGLYRGNTFRDAVDRAVIAKLLTSRDDVRFYNRESLTFWGCRFFDNEEEARRSFG